MDEPICKAVNGYLMILAWISCGLPRYLVKDAYALRWQFEEALQFYSKTNLEGIELAKHVREIIRPTST